MNLETTRLLQPNERILDGDFIEWTHGAWTRITKESLLIGMTPTTATEYIRQRVPTFKERFRRSLPNA